MARGTQLQTLVSMLKAESSQSASVALNVDQAERYKTLLRRVQETLYDDYDWPHMRVITSKALVAGSRFYDFPTSPYAINFERLEEVVVYYNNQPHSVSRGIGFEHYAQYNPDQNERADPVRAWDVRWTGSKEQIEVWPLPASGDMTMQFKGIRPLRAMTADSDVADLDDQLLVLYAAAEILAKQESKDADAKLAAAERRYNKLKGRTKGATNMAVYGGGDDHRRRETGTIIRVS